MRVAATLMLLLLLSPVLLALSRNGVLVFPLWWAVAYFVFRACFPQSKQASVPALAVLGGSLAYVAALSLFWSGAMMGLNLHAAALLIGMLWLFFTQSRIAAFALIVLQVVVSVTGAQLLLQFDFAGAFANRSSAIGTPGALLASVFSHVFAIVFLTIFILRRPQADARVVAPV
ncbi:MAG: hypothetical protein K2P58_12815 [Hyphomonadaceae bacterium]|nr:hypothetical protein [Hyphomonadaceae bacterium]